MAYSELLKNFDAVRGYLRDFYVYGFKSRDDFSEKSGRSYDDERRRVESWLGDHIGTRQTPDGKNVFLSIDSRAHCHNPLYRVWQTASFTDGDITLHFILFDILSSPDVCLPLSDIMDKIDVYLSDFSDPHTPDISTVRKKLGEYVKVGLIETERRGKTVYYRCAPDCHAGGRDAVAFFSEAAPCGVIGSFMLDRGDDYFSFKHHYITGALDSGVMCRLLDAMNKKRDVIITSRSKAGKSYVDKLTPLRIFISAGGGREYLMAYDARRRRVQPFRIDGIRSVADGEECPEFSERRALLDRMMKHIWGVNTQGSGRLEHVEFTVYHGDDESFIYSRLEREKRCGSVARVDENHSRFEADVYDSNELVPFIRSFLCRITDISFSNQYNETKFRRDIEAMYAIYGIGDERGKYIESSAPTRSEKKVPTESGVSVKKTASVTPSVTDPSLTIHSELYGAYYRAVASILKAAVDHPVTPREVRSIAREEAFSESASTIESALYGERWHLLRRNGTTPIKNPPRTMLTLLEKRWLKSISLDPRIKLFDFDTSGLEGVEPLFTPDDIYVFDKYSDGDDYEDEGYIERFRMILDAVKQKTPLVFDVKNKKGNMFSVVAVPLFLEYSEKDDKFRLYCSGSRRGRIINLGRIVRCRKYTGSRRFFPNMTSRAEQRTVTIELFDKRNLLERAVLHFAHFEKQVIKLGGDRFLLRVRYSVDDETELLIRVLSFGPFLKVTEPDDFVRQIKERLARQKSCGM